MPKPHLLLHLEVADQAPVAVVADFQADSPEEDSAVVEEVAGRIMQCAYILDIIYT